MRRWRVVCDVEERTSFFEGGVGTGPKFPPTFTWCTQKLSLLNIGTLVLMRIIKRNSREYGAHALQTIDSVMYQMQGSHPPDYVLCFVLCICSQLFGCALKSTHRGTRPPGPGSCESLADIF